MFIHVDDGLLFGASIENVRAIEILSDHVMMRIVGLLERLGNHIFFVGRVIARTARGDSVGANPKYIRDVIAVLGLEESRPVATPSVKRTSTEEELENGKRTVYKTALGKLLYMCQEHADIMMGVKETARKILCPTESDEMNMKRIARNLKGVSSAKCLIEINTFPQFVNVYTDIDWARQHLTCKSTRGGVTQWRSATLSAWSRTQQSVSLSPAEAELNALTTSITQGMVTKHLLKELGHEVTLLNHVDSQSVKAWASKRGLGRMKLVMLKYMFGQDVVEKKQTTLVCVQTNSNKADLMTKCHTFEAHLKGCAMVGLKLSRDDGKLAGNNHSDPRAGQKCPDLKGECGESRTFSAANFMVSSEFTLGDN